MKLTRQQVMLAVLVVVALANVGDRVVTSMIQGPLQQRRDRTTALEEAIEKRESLLAEARRAGRQISRWQKQSLPADPEMARSLYRSWLLERVNEAGVGGATVDSGSPSARRGLYIALPFSVRGRCTLPECTQLLFTISQAPHLHRIDSLTLTPAGNDVFDLALGIEALIVSGTKHTDRLARGTADLLAFDSVGDYQLIARENLFGLGYRDPLQETRVTAITRTNGEPRIWIDDNTDRGVRKLRLDDRIDVGGLAFRVISATDEQVVLEANGQHSVVELGQTLADARPLPPGS